LFIFTFALTPTFGALNITPAYAAGILYATPGGTGDCSSWANACTLQTALTGAVSDDEIWAAAGTHKPTTMDTDRNATFQLKDGMALYGGFAGTESNRIDRNPQTNVTILSGDIDNNDSQMPVITDLTTVTGNTTNSYHVVTGATGVTLDGFIITAGNANGDDIFTSGSGGGMYNTYSATSILTDVIFSGNSAIGNGGGMFNTIDANPTLTDVTFSNNAAAECGGGMYNEVNSSLLTNVTFSNNTANGGGGMCNYYGSNPTLMDVTFSGNSATSDGGGMLNDYGTPTLTNVTFSGNTAEDGGGMANWYEGDPTLMNVTFSGNTATSSGGGMYNSNGSTPTVMNVTFSGNTATSSGGGMYNSSGSTPTVMNVTFTGNHAYSGGGMYNRTSSPTLTNVTFSDNTAIAGGGMENWSSSPTLTNVTFSNNSVFSVGGGMLNNTSSSPQIHNTIFWGNTAQAIDPPGTAQIGNINESTSSLSDSVIQDGCPPEGTCTNIIIAYPLLGTLGNYGGFTQTIPLLFGSSAINTGNDGVCPATDQRGVTRPQGAHCDIGAFEVIVIYAFLPFMVK
jgi:hypothetical protein